MDRGPRGPPCPASPRTRSVGTGGQCLLFSYPWKSREVFGLEAQCGDFLQKKKRATPTPREVDPKNIGIIPIGSMFGINAEVFGKKGLSGAWMSGWKLGSMVSRWVITY